MTVPNPQAVRRGVLLARASSVAVTVIGCLVLVGWLLGVGWLKSVFPGYASMKANTAMGLMLTGAALTLFSLGKQTKAIRFLTMLAGALVVTLGVLTLGEYLGGWNLGIDQWLSRDDPHTVGTSEPGRMAPGTAFCFVMIGIACLVSACAIPARWRHPLLAGLGAAVIVAGVLAFAFYISDASLHSRWWNYSGMAFDTATAFVLLGCALLALVKSEGGMTWTLNRSITVGFIIGVAMMVITSAFSYGLTNRLLETASWVSHTREVLEKIQEVTSGMADMESGQRGYTITGDERLLEDRKRAESAVHEGLAELRRLTADNASQQRRLDPLKTLVQRHIDFGDQTIAARRNMSIPTAEETNATGAGIKLSNNIRQRLNEMRNEEYTLLKKRQDQSNAASTSAFLFLPLGVLFGLTILSLGFFFLNAGVGERAQAERALQQSEARMAGIVTSAMDAIISIDQTQRIVLFNSAAEKMFRLPAAEIMGESLDRLIPRRFRGQHGQHVEGFGKTGVTSRSMRSLGALSGLRADGEEFPIEASISQVQVAGEQIYTVILRDITERKRADEAAALLSAIVESSSDAIIGKDLESNVTSWNAGAERMFGYTAGEIVGHSITQLFPADRQDDEGKIIARIKRGESVEHFETVRVKKGGELIDVSVTVSPIKNSAGEIIGVSKVARDVTDQKRAAQALRESEERLHAVTENLTEGLIVSDINGQLLHWNRAGLEMHGFRTLEEGLRMMPEFAEIFDLRTLDGISMSVDQWPLARVLRGERLRDAEVRIHRRGGDWYRVFNYSGNIIHDASGQPLAFVAMSDITERKQAEDELASSRAQLQAIFDNITEGICVIDPENDVVNMNPACRRLVGLSEPGMSRTDMIPLVEILSPNGEIVPQEDWPGHRALRGDFVQNYELVMRQKVSGRASSLEYNTAPIRDKTGKARQVIVSFRDVTERRQTEARYRTLFEYAPDGILIADSRSCYLDANASICRMLGYARDELVGLNALDIVVPSEIPHIGEALSVIESKSDYQREWEFRRKDGSVFAAEVIATMMPDGNLLGMIRDITERKRADATLREVEKEKQLAYEANRLKSEFLANMSHELRTPLNCIIGFTEFLVDEKPGPLNPKQKEYLTDVYASSKHLLQLINDVLDLAKVEAGKIELHLESFPLAKAIEEVCAVVKGIAQKKGVTVTSRVAPQDPNVTLDEQKFKQVCYNLLSNAVKFTDPGGSVEITALAREGEQFEVRVKDTGIGIKQEDRHRLFREFEQLDSGADRRFEGTGLGLALTKKLVESHGGSIGVESEYGSGSTFFAILPTIAAEVKERE